MRLQNAAADPRVSLAPSGESRSTSTEVKYLVFHFSILCSIFCFLLWNVEKIRTYCIFFIIYPFVLKTLFRLVKI